ncbi:MAG: hypothetical protein AB1345_01505 [Chloroflexota bacterium]
MEEVLRFFQSYEVLIYILLGVGFVVYLRHFVQAWGELRQAVYGLERESAHQRLNHSAVILVLTLLAAVSVFVLVSFVSPTVSEVMPLPTSTLGVVVGEVENTVIPEAGALAATATPLPTIQVDESGCVEGQLAFTSPQKGEQVSGTVEIIGTIDVPNFGFYLYEMARPGESLWLTIGAGRELKRDERLGYWETTNLPRGEYILRLVVTDSTGVSLTPCMISVFVTEPE